MSTLLTELGRQETRPEAFSSFQQWNRDSMHALGALSAGIIVICVPVTAHILSPFVAIPMAFLLAGLVANYAPRVAVASILVALIFQNLFVSLVSSDLSGPGEFKIIRGYNFLILLVIWLVTISGYLRWFRGRNQTLDTLMNATFLAMILVFFYFAFGFIQNPTPAIIYLRNITSPLMIFQVVLLICARFEFRLSAIFFFITLLVVVLGYVELLFRDEWLRISGSDSYWDLQTQEERLSLAWDKQARKSGLVVTGFIDTITVDFFNTPLLGELDLKVTRLMGPNMHAISYSYVVSFLLIFALFRGAPISALLLLPLLIFANAKGALILLILVILGWVAFKLFGTRLSFYVLCAGLLVYAVAGVFVGLNIGDFHVLGFMGGLHNFIQFPFGHGIGVGGNLATDFAKLDWPEYQAVGRTPVAIESAVGVLLYQMGPGAFLLLAIYVWIAWHTVRVASFTGISLHVVAGFTLLTILVNGIFQEEALFSPLAFGLLISLNGMVLGQAIRRGFTL